MLIVFGGLPGTGKSTLAREIARIRSAIYLRIDTIEQALRPALGEDVADAGYRVAYALAESNLRQGLDVVADSVNPIMLTRDAWRDVAASVGARSVEIEVICSDAGEHQRRVETRTSDVAGLKLPNWREVLDREYEPWNRPRIVVDTAGCLPAASLREIALRLEALGTP
jgi:predicted kinase